MSFERYGSGMSGTSRSSIGEGTVARTRSTCSVRPVLSLSVKRGLIQRPRVVRREPDSSSDVDALITPRLGQPVDQDIEAPTDVSELFAGRAGQGAIASEEHLIPEPDHRDFFGTRAEFGAQLRPPDLFERPRADRAAQPLPGCHALKFAPRA